MKEHPILFKSEMIKAILEGRKSQTRRIIKPQPIIDCLPDHPEIKIATIGKNQYWLNSQATHPDHITTACRFAIGDRLWVKETYFILEPEHCEGMNSRIIYKNAFHQSNEEWRLECIEKGYYQYKWRSALFMPKLYFRILLEIMNIRVEPLNNISEKDAEAEGCVSTAVLTGDKQDYTGLYASEHYAQLWERINGKDSWQSNPFVWVIEFKRINK